MSKLIASQLPVALKYVSGHWEAEVENTKELRKHWVANNVATNIRVCGTSSISFIAALNDLKDRLDYLQVEVESLNVSGDWLFLNP